MHLHSLIFPHWRLLSALLTVLTLCQCESLQQAVILNDVSRLPSEIPLGCTKARMVWHKGYPAGKEPWYYNSNDLACARLGAGPCACGVAMGCASRCNMAHVCRCHPDAGTEAKIGEIWHYKDDMNAQKRYWDVGFAWESVNFASWDCYFDNRGRYAGWRLVEPLNAQGRARERFVTSDYGRRARHVWNDKVHLITTRLREYMVTPGVAPLTVQKACHSALADLETVSDEFPERQRLDMLKRHCRYVESLPASNQASFEKAKSGCVSAMDDLLKHI